MLYNSYKMAIDTLDAALKKLSDQLKQTSIENQPLIKAAQLCLNDILHILLPTVFEAENHLAALIRQKNKNFCNTSLKLPVATKTIAEIIMAGVDQRPTAFRPLKEKEDFPEGIYSLSPPPRKGFEELKDWTTDFDQHIVNKFVGEDVSERTDDFLFKIELANQKLEHLATRSNDAYSYYS